MQSAKDFLNKTSALQTDLYQLTMAAAYFQNQVDAIATFELFAYDLPKKRSFIVACGLEQIVEFIQSIKFEESEISYLRKHPSFKHIDAKFFDYLRNFKFSGDLFAVPEGTIVFAREPLIQVRAPIIEAQLLETYLLSMMHIQSLVATKATRVVSAAEEGEVERGVVDFGSRRAHGPEAAVLSARACYIAGCMGTSNVYAGLRFGIPIYGTMAHSYIKAFNTEEEAFRKYFSVYPQATVLLIDTYDTLKGAELAVKIGKAVKGVRLDSGNLSDLSVRVRKILDRGDLKETKILASGNLDEYKIQSLLKGSPPIDMFGVGTNMVTSSDNPVLNFIYKLVQLEGPSGVVKGKAKFSKGKETYPGKKQIFRKTDDKGMFIEDTIDFDSGRYDKDYAPLLEPVIKNAEQVKPLPSLNEIRVYLKNNLGALDRRYKQFKKFELYPVKISDSIKATLKDLKTHKT